MELSSSSCVCPLRRELCASVVVLPSTSPTRFQNYYLLLLLPYLFSFFIIRTFFAFCIFFLLLASSFSFPSSEKDFPRLLLLLLPPDPCGRKEGGRKAGSLSQASENKCTQGWEGGTDGKERMKMVAALQPRFSVQVLALAP